MAAAVDEGALRRRGRRPRHRVTFLGVVGELLITLGVVTLLYVSWQLWIGDILIGSQMKDEAQSLSQQWAEEPAAPLPSATGGTTPAAPPATADPPALPEPAAGQEFGVVWIPRFGPDFSFRLAGGVDTAVTLDPIGIGHYPETAMPGQMGNFAVAGHRGSHGAPFQDLPSLRIGDAVVIETQEGWFTYRFRNLEYVRPSAVDVLLPVPQVSDIATDGRYITMTTCSPRYGSSERAIAYGVFESFTPRSSGAPVALTEGATA
nr:class E sortase [Microbacterium lemovicicum]